MVVEYPISVTDDSPFPIENIPFGIFSTDENPTPRIATIIGDQIIDVKFLANNGVFDIDNAQERSSLRSALSCQTLNNFAALPRAIRSFTRERIIELLQNPSSILFTNKDVNSCIFVDVFQARLHLPMMIGAFADFLCSETHLENGNRMSGKSMPAFYHFPPMYTGRTTSIIPSGQAIKRPKGMIPAQPGSSDFEFKTSAKFDFEVEMGMFVSKPVALGQRIEADDGKEHIFGLVLLNDWSARDIQFGEMIPMGPSNGKASGTTISPWVVMPEALEEAEIDFVSQRAQADMPSHPPHLRHSAGNKFLWDINIEATVRGPGEKPAIVCRSNFKDLYWSPGQMLAHFVSAGSGSNSGDLLGTGTASSPGHTSEAPTLGCLFELTEGGRKPFELPSGRKLSWLEDGDEVILTGWARGKGGKRIGFGEAAGRVLPSE